MIQKLIILFTASLLFTAIHPFTTHHFYRASYLPNPVRFERDWLSSCYLQLAGGSTCKARNACGDTVPLLALYTPNENLKARCAGIFDIFEANFDLIQNFKYGLFLEFYIPVRVIHFQPHFIKSQQDSYYQEYLNEHGFDAMFSKVDHYFNSFRKCALADCALLAGWSHTWLNTTFLDFIDTSFEFGMLFPTDKTKCIYDFFCIPYGYNGHYGFPITTDIAFGMFNWLTLGLHGDLFNFFTKHRKGIIQNCPRNSDSSPLSCSAEERIKPGFLGCASTYLTSDHFAKGCSATLGYSYVHKRHDKVCNTKEKAYQFVCQDPTIKSWAMHTLHLFFEYDFSTYDSMFGPRFAIIYNRQLAGKRVFQTSMVGAQLVADFEWCF